MIILLAFFDVSLGLVLSVGDGRVGRSLGDVEYPMSKFDRSIVKLSDE